MTTTPNPTEETAQVARVVDARVVFQIPMLDEPVHTAENGYRCSDPTCPCFAEAEARRLAAPLNKRGFSLLK